MKFEKPTIEQLRHRYLHHPPTPDQCERYQLMRWMICEAAQFCVNLTPCSPEQQRALNALDEACSLFIAAIARNEPDGAIVTEAPNE